MLKEKLPQLRKAQGLSQEQLAERLHVSRQAISKWETGDSAPDIEKLMRLGEIFQVSLDYLLTDAASSLPACSGGSAPATPAQRNPRPKRRLIIIAAIFLALGLALGLLLARAQALPDAAAPQAAPDLALAGDLVAGFSHGFAYGDNESEYTAEMQFSIIPSVSVAGLTAEYMLIDAEGKVSLHPAEREEGTAFLARIELELYKEYTLSVIFRAGGYEYSQPLLEMTAGSANSYTWEELWRN